MILVSHPTGNANVRGVLRALEGAGMLDSFCTSIGVSDSEAVHWRNFFFQKRRYPIPRSRLKLRPVRECVRLVAAGLGCKQLTRHETGWASIDSVYRDQDRAVSSRLRREGGQLHGVYCYEDGALETFRAARELGLCRIYDLPIAFWETAQKLLREEAARLPEWEPTLGGTRDSVTKLSRKTEEMDLAETIICPSQFVADSLPGEVRIKKRIAVAPFGSPPASGDADRPQLASGKKLRVLFAGSMTQRKGLGDLFSAMRILGRKDVELVVMGSPQASLEFYRGVFDQFTYEPCRPHAEVLQLMRSCDVFCLPSIVEGRALVMQEAMSQGLPLIITPNTGGADLIEEGVTGFLVPIRRPDRLAQSIAWFADHRSSLCEMSRAAKKKAALLTWEAYGKTVADAIRQLNCI